MRADPLGILKWRHQITEIAAPDRADRNPRIGYNDAVKQARQSLAGALGRWREEGPDSIERGDG
jgi:hypothetical protein